MEGIPVNTVRFRAEGGNVRVHLIQEKIEDTPRARIGQHLECRLGWAMSLKDLKARLQYGVDLGS